ncbi:hypothetical protein R6Q59_030529 [Mikania micrantha]
MDEHGDFDASKGDWDLGKQGIANVDLSKKLPGFRRSSSYGPAGYWAGVLLQPSQFSLSGSGSQVANGQPFLKSFNFVGSSCWLLEELDLTKCCANEKVRQPAPIDVTSKRKRCKKVLILFL